MEDKDLKDKKGTPAPQHDKFMQKPVEPIQRLQNVTDVSEDLHKPRKTPT